MPHSSNIAEKEDLWSSSRARVSINSPIGLLKVLTSEMTVETRGIELVYLRASFWRLALAWKNAFVEGVRASPLSSRRLRLLCASLSDTFDSSKLSELQFKKKESEVDIDSLSISTLLNTGNMSSVSKGSRRCKGVLAASEVSRAAMGVSMSSIIIGVCGAHSWRKTLT
jgi:hypothetical protein